MSDNFYNPQEAAWERAAQMIAFVKLGKAVDNLVAAFQTEMAKLAEKLALHLPEIGEDMKAAERARSKADVKAKRRAMMKRRGRK